ncbi:gamma-aminobutyric acid receptor subunit beta-3-like isoform X2 [Antedon mediterranea]|uniref:gamma-aminobutyric acid receptor subunit beta-3-like isoform X2 n=1 Tax=Antedon mediterranea TaxID=105859 RepID=UPI003AF4E34F
MSSFTIYFSALLCAVIFSSINSGSATLAEDHLLNNASEILNTLLDGYDKRLRPHYGGKRVNVQISMYIYNIGPISETNMEYTMDLYFRQQWNDPRLAFDGSVITGLALTNEMAKRVWIPDTYFINEKKASYHTILTENTLISITPSGDMLYSTRLTLTAGCLMDLKYFPMDTQHCDLWLESYAYSNQHVKYSWVGNDSSAIYLDPSIALSQFNLLGNNGVEAEAVYYVGNYSQLIGNFYLGRSMSYYAIQVYVPATMIVILSWVSFWINPAAVPARIALGITTVLTMTTLMSGVNNSLPKLSYIKAIDYYLVFCYLCVFAALLEFAMVSYGSTPPPKKPDESKPPPPKQDTNNVNRRQSGIHNSGFIGDGSGPNTKQPKSVEAGETAKEESFNFRNIDNYSRFFFPITFIVFLFIYWIYYLTKTAVDIDELTKTT